MSGLNLAIHKLNFSHSLQNLRKFVLCMDLLAPSGSTKVDFFIRLLLKAPGGRMQALTGTDWVSICIWLEFCFKKLGKWTILQLSHDFIRSLLYNIEVLVHMYGRFALLGTQGLYDRRLKNVPWKMKGSSLEFFCIVLLNNHKQGQ